MPRTIAPLAVLVLLCGLTCTACAKPPLREIIDPAEAAKEPDFKIQGEYVGEGTWFDGPNVKAAAQVIAWGNGQFTVVVTKGGLPGDGWQRGEPRFTLAGKRQDGTTTLSGNDPRSSLENLNLSGKIAGEAMSLSSADGKLKLELKQTIRHSPTEGAKPPEGAVVLFDGTTAENFIDGEMSPDKNLMSEATSKRKFGDYTLHVELRLSYMPEARGQARSNSGVYLHDCYEIQVLDSFGLEGDKGDCGAIYGIRQPDVNMCYPPLTWQTYDVDFTAPRYKDGKKVANGRVTVRHNGVVIHKDFELPHGTPGRQPEGPGPRPIYLQGHGNKVEFRNIWVKEKSPS